MGIDFIETEQTLGWAVIALVLLGCVGFLVARRWPRAVALFSVAALYPSWVLVRSAVEMLRGDLPAEYTPAVVGELALTAVIIALGFGLPLLGTRRQPSRPAV